MCLPLNIIHKASALLFVFTLSACGGGGSNDTEPNFDDANDNFGGSSSGNSEDNETFKDTGLVINELMKSISLYDGGDVKDENNMRQSWLELYNDSGASVNLDGYSLVAEGLEKQVWTFPNMSLGNGAHLRIWGSGLDRTDRLDSLHTSFSLNASEKLSLVHSDGSILDRLQLSLPADQSWGRYPDGASEGYYYDRPTPGKANQQSSNRFSLNCENLSLTAGGSFQLVVTPETNVSWSYDSSILAVDSKNVLTTKSDGAVGRDDPMKITATDNAGSSVTCMVTVVNWMANRSSLVVVANPPVDFFLDNFDDGVYYTQPRKIFKTDDSFKSTTQLGSFPPTPSSPVMKKTPYGYFVSSGRQIYSTQDFNTWSDEFSMRHKNLQHGFSHYHDSSTQTSYLYAGEYSTGKEDLHSIYRGTSTSAGNTQWQSVLDWQSEGAFDRDNSNIDTIRHVHLTVTDPYTGHVWVGTGDRDQHSRLYYSKDNGNSFTLVGIGSQKFRSLSVWFTKDYVYWNMDSERAKQYVYRLPRSKYRQRNAWPSLTPELSTGSTKPGIRYMVVTTKGGHFPVSSGRIYTETNARVLSTDERAFAIEDPQFDYSESVAELTHASHWYHLWVKDQNDENVLLMATSTEGNEFYRRDENSRVFGFKERSDGSVDVQELLSMPSNKPGVHTPYSQLIPAMQDSAGNIYFRGRYTGHRAYQMRLNWVDQ